MDATKFTSVHLLLVGLFAIPGAGLRLLLAWCVEQAYGVNQPAALAAAASASYFVPNIVGCFVLGFVARAKPYAAAMRSLSAARPRYARVPELVLGAIGTGFCGSLTTFASWMKGVNEALVRGEVAWAGSVLVLMLAASWAAMRLGTLAASSWLSCGEHERCRAVPCCARLAVSRALVDVGALLAPGGRVANGAEDARALARLVEECDNAATARPAAIELAAALDACAVELDAMRIACAPDEMELQPVLPGAPATRALDDTATDTRGVLTPTPSAPPTPCAACTVRFCAALPALRAIVLLGALLVSAAALFGVDRFGEGALIVFAVTFIYLRILLTLCLGVNIDRGCRERRVAPRCVACAVPCPRWSDAARRARSLQPRVPTAPPLHAAR